MNFLKKIRSGVTLAELLVVLSIIVFLSTSLYRIMSSVGTSFLHARAKLDILMTTRIIMSGIRNDLRNAVEKPQAQVIDKRHFLYIPLKDKSNKDRVAIYMFDEEKHRIFRGEKGEMSDPDPDISAFHAFLFDDGQILKFEFDSSYRDADSFAESELSLDAKVWFKVSMKILFTERFTKMKKEDKQKIASDPNDPRVKTFFMMITPRRVNWLLQATQ
jgi:prepilin-type N-terminal cleavage/methylation domain-containing protein